LLKRIELQEYLSIKVIRRAGMTVKVLVTVNSNQSKFRAITICPFPVVGDCPKTVPLYPNTLNS
jgi:hypothetical protein